MSKYKPTTDFTVTLIWFVEGGVRKRRFRKYTEAVEWANKNLNTDEIVVRIIGTIQKQEEEG